jgi:Protein of unknown function (DUF3489)
VKVGLSSAVRGRVRRQIDQAANRIDRFLRSSGESARESILDPSQAPAQELAALYHEGSKKAQVVALLQRKNGATLVEIMEKMGWQKHTVRGFMAGAMKKAGYIVESFKSDKGERTYRVKA